MSRRLRITKREAQDLAEKIEAGGGDASELRAILEAGEDEAAQQGTAGEMSDEEYLALMVSKSSVEQGIDLECLVCHDKTTRLISGTCETCFRSWVLSSRS